MNSNRLQLIYIIATCILAVAAIGSWKVGCEALHRSDKATTASEKATAASESAAAAAENANTIAEKAYNIALQTNLPLINAHCSLIYEYSQNWTEKMTVTNDRGKIGRSDADAYFLMCIQVAGKTVRIPIVGYFSNPNPTLAREGLLYTFSYEKNYAKFLNILDDFEEAARKDGYEPGVWGERILYIRYSAAALGTEDAQNQFEEYFSVYEKSYPRQLTKEDAKKPLDSVNQLRDLAENGGLYLYIWELNGVELWSWFKAAFLK